MKILAIDTSSKICSVSILEDKNLIMEKHNDDEKTHSQKLMPLIDELFKECNLSLEDIDLLACSIGPGSFTGLRIGISTVKAFSDVTNIPICGVTSLESLAYNLSEPGLIASIIDAKNENVYFSLFSHFENTYTKVEDFCADNIHNIISILSKYNNKPITFVGNGSLIYHDLISENLENIKFATDDKNLQTSISIGKSAHDKYLKGLYGDSNSIIPLYLRKSQAERALDRRKIILEGFIFMENLTICKMTFEDLESIKYELNEKFDEFWTYGILKSEIANINSRYIIAKFHNEIVGFAGFSLIIDEANIMNIVTKKEKRNLGIASCLLENLIYLARDENASSITLEVNVNNLPAVHLYEKFNFKKIGFRKKYYNNTDDALIMTLYLY